MSEDVKTWLDETGLSQYSAAFAENSITRQLLPTLTADDLKELGLNVGERRQFLNAVATLREREASPGTLTPTEHTTHIDTAERRQLTVMFCDLVESTHLSGQLDPEELREVVRAYQKAAEDVIQRFEGHIAQYLGDGLLVYFGYPLAHEDDAQRAVFSGVEIPKAISILNTQLQARYSVNLSVRIGIHTGPVVVGEMGGNERHENLAMGETPNLAARLEGLAKPGAVVISENTRRLLGELFALTPLGDQNLKGISVPVKAFTVTGERLAETRFAAGQSDAVAAMVGRQQELALLLDRWRQAKVGEGQVVVLTGEAGIGKSHIVSALVAALAREDHRRVSYQCSPYHADSALYPAIRQITYAAGIDSNETRDAKLTKLEELLNHRQENIQGSTLLLGTLLGLGEAVEARHGIISYTAQERRERTLQVLVDLLIGSAHKCPVLFVLEDAHWIDPTTLEMIDMALERIRDHCIMLLITARPTFNHGFGGHPIVSRLTLNRLGREAIVGIVERITQGKSLPTELLDEIASKTDGIPLFVEEFTKTVLESGQLRESEQGYEIDGRLNQLTIPSSLHDSLMARLDRIQPIKIVAQEAACIGREFDYSLLSAISSVDEVALQLSLKQLVAAELIFRRGSSPNSTYTFKHALVRDAAYQSQLNVNRRDRHARIGDTLENQFANLLDNLPEVAAHHFTEAGDNSRAAHYWEKAGLRAIKRSENGEATGHLSQAIVALQSLPADVPNVERELNLHPLLTGALIATKGYGAPEIAHVLRRAETLTPQTDNVQLLYPIHYGNWVYKTVWAEHASAQLEATRLVKLAKENDDDGSTMVGQRLAGTSLYLLGALQAATDKFSLVVDTYRPEEHAELAFRYGQDPKASALAWNSSVLLCLGHYEKARQSYLEATSHAVTLNHANTTAYALYFGALVTSHLMSDLPAIEQYSTKLLAFAEEQKLSVWRAYSQISLAWLHSRSTNGFDGAADAKAAMDELQTMGMLVYQPFSQCLLSDIHREQGDSEQAMRAVNAALNQVKNSEERWYEPEIYRKRAELFLETDGPDSQSLAESDLDCAVSSACAMGARAWQLRASNSRARLWINQERFVEAKTLIGAIVDQFSETSCFADLIEARALLAHASR